MIHKMEDENALYGVAVDVLERVGAIKTCEIHGDRYLAEESKLVDAYKVANSWISKGYADCDRRELTDAIKGFFETTLDECPSCAHIKYEDD